MKTTLSFSIAILLICTVVLVSIPTGVLAVEVQSARSIFTLMGAQGEAIKNNSIITQQSNVAPAITVLTHGMDATFNYWGIYDWILEEDSLPLQLFQQYNTQSSIPNATMYLVKSTANFVETTEFAYDTPYHKHEIARNEQDKYFIISEITKDSADNYKISTSEIGLDDIDFCGHTIFVFQESNVPNVQVENEGSVSVGAELDLRYDEFHYIVDSISYAYKQQHNVIPRINLIGHSRGGLINMAYAIEHKYNVENLISLGTPYNSTLLTGVGLHLNLCPEIETRDIDTYAPVIKQAWNENDVGLYVNTKVISSTMDIRFMVAMLQDYEGSLAIGVDDLRNYFELAKNIICGIDIVEDCVDRLTDLNKLLFSPALYLIDLVVDIQNELIIKKITDEIDFVLENEDATEDDFIDAAKEILITVLYNEQNILSWLVSNGFVIDNMLGDGLVPITSQQALGYENIPQENIVNFDFSAEPSTLDENVMESTVLHNGQNVSVFEFKGQSSRPGAPHNLQCRYPPIVEEVLETLELTTFVHFPEYSNNGNTHTKTCACGSVVEEHDYTYSQIGQISPNCVEGGVSPMAVILPLPNSNLYVHRATCTKCAYTTQLEHDWTEFGTGYKCADCLLFSTNIPIARPDNYFTIQQQIAIGTLLEGQTVAISDTEQVTLIGGVYYLSHVNVGLEPVLPPAEDC